MYTAHRNIIDMCLYCPSQQELKIVRRAQKQDDNERDYMNREKEREIQQLAKNITKRGDGQS